MPKGTPAWNKSNTFKGCLECNVRFHVSPSRLLKTKYCSRRCYIVELSRRMSGERHPMWRGGGIEVICKRPECQNKFLVPRCRINRSRRSNSSELFCSRSCSAKTVSGFQQKEYIPHNKGLKGYTNAGSFKKGQLSPIKGKCGLYQHTNEWKQMMHDKMSGALNRNWRGGKPKCIDCKKQLSSYVAKRCSQCDQLNNPKKFPYTNTSIEIKLQNFLKAQNIPFETHYPILGQPDIFIKSNICIFADGCYWHKCPDCGYGHGKERDAMVTQELQKQGYTVIRFWEHEINNSLDQCFDKLKIA